MGHFIKTSKKFIKVHLFQVCEGSFTRLVVVCPDWMTVQKPILPEKHLFETYLCKIYLKVFQNISACL